MTYENVLVDVRDAVAFVTINRPSKLNALDGATIRSLDLAFSRLAEDADVRGVVLTGAGERAFVSGADVEELRGLSTQEARAFAERGQRLLDRVEGLGKPVVAAVNGYALGGGCELALACHLRVASDNAVFGTPEVRLGLVCGFGGTQRLPRLIGRGRALEMLLTGDRVDTTEALRTGLVNKVVFRDRLATEAEVFVRRMIANSPRALRATLEAVHGGLERPLAEGLEGEAALFAELIGSEDTKEGLQAWFEGRPPRFTGR